MRNFGKWMIAVTLVAAIGLAVQPAAEAQSYDQDRDRDQDQRWQSQRTRDQDRPMDRRSEWDRPDRQGDRISTKLVKADELMGESIRGRQEEDIASVEDIVLMPGRGEIQHVIVSQGGFLGIGTNQYAIPWDRFNARQTQQYGDEEGEIVLSLNMSEDDFDRMTPIDEKRDRQEKTYRDRTDRTERRDTQRRDSGIERAGESVERGVRKTGDAFEDAFDYDDDSRSSHYSTKVSELNGKSVLGSNRQELGEIEDVVLDLQNGQAVFAIISVETDELDLEEDMVALPWHELDIMGEQVRVTTATNQLQQYAFSGDTNELKSRMRMEGSRPWMTQREDQESTRYGRRTGDQRNQPFEQRSQRSEQRSRQPMYGSMGEEGPSVTVTGEITRVHSSRGELEFEIRTDRGHTVTVFAGDAREATRSGAEFNRGDKVTVRGHAVREAANPTVIANTIRTGGQEIRLNTDRQDWQDQRDDWQDQRRNRQNQRQDW
ncbi:MAG: PRC-barrel domain-containing protein [Candidatus Krumholzibacteriia bacterium]